MKQAIEYFHQLQASLSRGTKDGQLLQNLQTQLLHSIPLHEIDVQVYSRLMLSVYDVSNCEGLISVGSGGGGREQDMVIHPYGIRLKFVAMRMVCRLVQGVRQGHAGRLDREIEMEGLEIMILTTRMCLDCGVPYLSQVFQCWRYCEMLYVYCCGNGTTDVIGPDMEMLYVLDKMDILRLLVNQPTFSIPELQSTLQLADKIFQKLSTNPPSTLTSREPSQAQKYIQCTLTQITLKLLRQGNSDCLPQLQPYLPRDMATIFTKMGDRDNRSKVEGVGEVYELYWEICNSGGGMDSVGVEFLGKFVAREGVFGGEEIFEVVMLLDQPVLLELWFNEANRRTARPPNYPLAYECFISLIISSLTQPPSQPKTVGLIRLCRQVMLSLIRENKDTTLPINIICTYVTKFVVTLVIGTGVGTGQNFGVCVDMMENLEMISTKHSLPQTTKTILCLHLYYNLLNSCKNMDTYNKFLKLAPERDRERNQSMRLLKACAEVHLGLGKDGKEFRDMLRGRPQFLMVFCEGKEKLMLVLSLNKEDFLALGDIFEVYLALFDENCWDQGNLLLIANHLQNTLLSTQFSLIKTSKKSATSLKNSLGRFLQKQNTLFCMLFLYLLCLSGELEAVTKQKYGIVLNKYSKILKMLDLVALDGEAVTAIRIMICRSSENFKKQALESNGKCSPQAGQIIFLKIIYQKTQQWLDKPIHFPSEAQKNSQMFIKFCIFEIMCLNNRNQQLEQMIDQENSPQLQQIFTTSIYIPRKYKIILLRKLFKSDLMAQGSILTLKDIKELILLAQSPEESLIYVSSAIKMFGEKGKKFINLLALENPKVGELCLQFLNQTSN